MDAKHISILFIGTITMALVACHTEVPRKKPNVLLILTDQQPLSCVSAYGNRQIKTPNLDRLSETGTLLSNYYIAGFACSPSRASLLTGRFLHNHNVFTNNVKLDPAIPTLGSILAAENYHTGYFGKAHLGGQMYVGREFGDGIDYMHETEPPDPVGEAITQYWHYQRVETDSGWAVRKVDEGPGEDAPQLGFAEWAGGWRQYKDWLIEMGKPEFARLAGNHDDLQSAPEGEHMYSKLGESFHMAEFFTRKAEEFVRRHSTSNRPWAAVVSYFGPHLPVAPPKPWDTLYALDAIPLPSNFWDSLEGKPQSQYQPQLQYMLGQWSEEQYRDYIRRYWGYSGYLDSLIGRIFEALEQTGQWDNTLVVFTTDHGDMVGAHGMIYKLDGNAYEELFHVPAILRIPNLQNAQSRVSPLVSSIDVLPTILDALDIEPPGQIDGRSLIPVLRGESVQDFDAVFAETHGIRGNGKTIMCRKDQFKYVYHWLSPDVDELYDLAADPGEMHNLAEHPNYRDQASTMRKLIISWTRVTGHRYADLIAQKHLIKTN